MAARHPPVGIAHLTVVPENFEEGPEDFTDEARGTRAEQTDRQCDCQ